MITTNKWDPKPENYKEAIRVINRDTTIDWYFPGDTVPATDIAEPTYTVTPRQFRQALTALGYRAAVDAAVNQADQNTQDWYEFSTSFDSNHPVTKAFAVSLGFSEEQLENLFILASTL